MSPGELAAEIGMSHRVLRGWLRRQFPRTDEEHYARWDLDADQIAAARAHFGGRYTPGPARSSPARRVVQAVSQGPSDWYYEGNVVAVLVRWLEEQGYAIEFVANTAIKEQGDDIRARRDGRVLRVEVKGYPTKGRYADPARASEVKRTQPSTQAAHWYSQALLHVLRDLGRHPGDAVAIGLPDWPRFRSLINDTEAPLRKLGVACWLVTEDGKVEVRLPLPEP
jgi:hypothetical protein